VRRRLVLPRHNDYEPRAGIIPFLTIDSGFSETHYSGATSL